jgi:hypothetical protein
MKFNYLQYLTQPSPKTPSGILHRPKIPLRIIGGTGLLPTSALVDPGSDETLLPLSVGKLIGAKIDPTQSWQVEGIGGQVVAVILGEVDFELTDGKQTFRWSAKIGFVDFADPKDEVTVLGHAGFLDYFRVIFDGHRRKLEIELTPAFAGQVL